MTQSQCIDLLRELRGVERLIAAVDAMRLDPNAAVEWKYAVTAFDDRMRWLRYCASLEHPMAIAMADELLNAETMRATTRSEPAQTLMADDVPAGSRIH